MIDDRNFDDVVAGFYRAAQGECGWQESVQVFQESMDAWVVHLHAVDLAQQRIAYSYLAGRSQPEAEVDYLRTYHRIDPRASQVIRSEPGVWFNCWESFDEQYVAASPFYQDFLLPYGGRYVSGIKLIEDGSRVVVLGIHRGLGYPRLSLDEQQTAKRLMRHLTDALRIHHDRLARAHQMLLGSELLARLRAAVILIDEERRMLHVNPAARSLLASSAVLAQSGDRLFCTRTGDDTALAMGLRELLREPRAAATGADDKLYVRASSPCGGSTIGLYLYALRPAETLRVFGEQSLAMLILHEAGRLLELDPFVVAAAFDLTPAEARVAVAAAQGASPKEIADAHAVSTSTVRAQLSAVFHKTGTRRQAQLVSVLSSLPLGALGLI